MEFTQKQASKVIREIRARYKAIKSRNIKAYVNLQEFYSIIENYLKTKYKLGDIPETVEQMDLVYHLNSVDKQIKGTYISLAPGIVIFNASNSDMEDRLNGTVYRDKTPDQYGNRFYVSTFSQVVYSPTIFTLKDNKNRKSYQKDAKGIYTYEVGAGHSCWGDSGEITNECWDSLIPWLEKWLPIEISGPTEYE